MKYVMHQRLAHSTHAMDVIIISVHVLLLMVHTNMHSCYAFIYVCVCAILVKLFFYLTRHGGYT